VLVRRIFEVLELTRKAAMGRSWGVTRGNALRFVVVSNMKEVISTASFADLLIILLLV